MARRSRFSPEVRERAVRRVAEQAGERGSEWDAIRSIANSGARSRSSPGGGWDGRRSDEVRRLRAEYRAGLTGHMGDTRGQLALSLLGGRGGMTVRDLS